MLPEGLARSRKRRSRVCCRLGLVLLPGARIALTSGSRPRARLSRREPGAGGNAPREPQTPAGLGDIQGCGCGLHPGGVGPLGPSSEGAVQGGHAGECPEPAVPGTSSSQRRCDLLF
ncbi:uncharacterized protein LOC141559130 isoform X3 [Sminthopsis crassicaudata]|uniref:uncharacterized protein LOC141559130 isoform X3 n=1 Tax=Sminthopsis crassicaudata TaxID=9301 RepID=UPI003D699421